MAKLYDISNWSQLPWYNTGGTRNKKVYLNPQDVELYYFKESFKKGQRDYKFEFWSEIVASEIGAMLGLHVLGYDIAMNRGVFGCISKSMLTSSKEELIEGGKYLQAYDNTFNPDDTTLRNEYTFQLIVEALHFLNKEKHIFDVIETIVFDALIGNSDRHQENWATIGSITYLTEAVSIVENGLKSGDFESTPRLIKRLLKSIYTKGDKIRDEVKAAELLMRKTRFAPIYDSGCSFGRELSDERVDLMLKDKSEMEKYVSKGLAEIHWEKKKLTHFALLEKLLNDPEYSANTKKALTKIVSDFDTKRAEQIVMNVDNALVDEYLLFKLPDSRKQFIIQLLSLRINKLRELHSRY